MLVKIGKYNGNRNSGNIHTRVILTEIYHLSGMKSFRDDLIDRMKTGLGRLVLASSKSSSAYGTVYRIIEGFINVTTSSLKRVTGRISSKVSVFNFHRSRPKLYLLISP
jgi:hypothetical protein